jgi:hypothetical protein
MRLAAPAAQSLLAGVSRHISQANVLFLFLCPNLKRENLGNEL